MIVVFILAPLGLAGLGYAVVLLRSSLAAGAVFPLRLEALGLSAVSNFFDTLGISSFATTMSWMRFRGLVPDRLIPPTLVAGYTLPTVLQSFIFLLLLGVEVEPVLLGGCIVGMTLGGLVGARLVTRAPVRLIQALVGVALLIAGAFFILANLKLMPPGGHATGLPPLLMAIAIAVHLVLGVLVNFGVGNYAPTLVMLSLFGMDPRLAFPIMTSAAAFSVVGASVRLVRQEALLDLRIVLGLTIGAIPAILIAAFLVRDMPLDLLRWLVVAVVGYAGVSLLRSAAAGGAHPSALMEPQPPAL
jgi:uncharacterized membrane protein YfcA